jgi:hypothetical protein
MIEELLKSFICEINAKLFKAIKVEYFKASNIKYTNKVSSFTVFTSSVSFTRSTSQLKQRA